MMFALPIALLLSPFVPVPHAALLSFAALLPFTAPVLLLKSAPAVFALGFPVHLAHAALLHLAWRGRTRRGALATLLLFIAVLDLLPLAMLAAGFAGGSLVRHLGYFGLFTPLLVTAQSLAVAAPLLAVVGVAYGFRRRWRRALRRAGAWLLAGVTACAAVAVPFRILHDMTTIEVERHDVVVPGLPAELEGFRIGVLADMQMDAVTDSARIGAYVDSLASQDPDLVLFPGDLVAWSYDMEEAAAPLARLRAPHGVYAAIGDHDYWSGLDSVVMALRAVGVDVLANERRVLAVRGHRVEVGGVTNIYDFPAGEADVARVFEGDGSAALRLGVLHAMAPHLGEAFRAAGVRLVASGHTHGGQIGVWCFGAWLSTAWLESAQVSGMNDDGRLASYVSTGLGMSVVKLRYGATPGAAVIRLVGGRLRPPSPH